MKKITILLLTIFSLNSCKPNDGQKNVTVDRKYTITIPSFLTKVSNLNEDASLQYQHAWKEFYIIFIDESKLEMQKALDDNNLNDSYSNDLKGYSKLVLKSFEQKMEIIHKSTITDTLVNNMPAKLLTISGKISGIDAFYSLGFIQGKDRYYQIMAWTSSSKEFEYKDKMNKIMYSLKEF